MQSVSTRAGNVSYTVCGEGRPIILLHATLHDRHDFDPIVPQLSEHYQTISVDWPLHGDYIGPATDSSLTKLGAVELANVLEDFVTALDLPPAIIIGNSVGGFAAACLAIDHPNRVHALILVNTGGFTTWNLFNRSFCYLLGFPAVTRLVLPHLIPRYTKAQTLNDTAVCQKAVSRARSLEGASVAAAFWRSFLDEKHDIRVRARDIKAPTLIVWGANDIVFPVATAYSVQQSIPGSRLELFEAGHVAFSSRPEEFISVMEDFLL